MSNKKQTAVEWLVEQVFGKHTYVWNDVIEQAKQMEKEQITDAYLEGGQDIPMNGKRCGGAKIEVLRSQ